VHTVYAHLVTVLADKFEADAAQIGPDVSLEALELDSLAVVELFVTLQDQWGVPLDDNDAHAHMTVRELAESIDAQLATAGATPPTGERA
jgi:acyl carrier protein